MNSNTHFQNNRIRLYTFTRILHILETIIYFLLINFFERDHFHDKIYIQSKRTNYVYNRHSIGELPTIVL